MRKKLDSRFPASRIKKIMQADEDIGKIALAVPLLVSKALELFLQDLCDQTYQITLQRGAKTMNSLHLKQCIQTFNVFDFLREVVGKVPDLGCSDAGGEERSASKRRKVVDDEGNISEEESKRSKMHETSHTSGSESGRGRGRGRGRRGGRGSRTIERDIIAESVKLEDDMNMCNNNDNQSQNLEELDNGAELEESKEENASVGKHEPNDDASSIAKSADSCVRNFDPNVDLDENGDSTSVSPAAPAPAPVTPSTKPTSTNMHEENPGWSLSEIERMAINPIHLADLNTRKDEDEDEDYDEE